MGHRFTWRDAAEGETEPQLVSSAWSDSEAGAGMSYGVTHWDLPQIPDWVVVYSREPASLMHEMTSCVRVDGGACPTQ